MKTIKIFALLTALSGVLFSCNQEDVEPIYDAPREVVEDFVVSADRPIVFGETDNGISQTKNNTPQ